MLKNKEFKIILTLAVAVTLVATVTSFVCAGRAAGLTVGALLLLLDACLILYTKKRYTDIEALNAYLDKVLSGDETPDITTQEEGELSILKNNIYKTTTKLKHQQDLLAGDQKRMADALADISHQLKTPLTSMMVMNDLLETETDEEKRREFLQTQSAQLDRMNWLIQTLLKLSKIDAGTIVMKKAPVSSREFIKEALKPFAIQMDLKNIKCVTPEDDITLNCDKNWTLEAVQNIIKNCIEHMEEGGRLTLQTEDTNVYTQITIEDSGCGIAKDDLPHIFERFYKGKNAGKDSVGIGLALARTILTNQKGDILVESEEGVGSKFHIRLYKTIV
ncbi:MAG: HAMP domain-containing histidine kinase [Lachnospiraceae bacterium]|nr:HAMP domain-containing histidine kinase [Lachnospiraceae bacterium]